MLPVSLRCQLVIQEMSEEHQRLLALARDAVAASLARLPADLRDKARAIPVTYEPRPSPGMMDDGIAPDTLGLFCGEALNDLPSDYPVPNQIILFLEVIWDFSGCDRETYLDEIHKTFLHELGHYFGFDEEELAQRGLE
jgi:predicted Zn-dependent protease with MMP-like domain